MKMGSLRAWGCGCAVLVLGVALAGWAEPAERVPAAGVSLMVRRPVAEELLEKLARIPVEQAEPRTCAVEFPAQQARFIRLDIRTTGGNTEPCLDELEVYGPGGPDNLALGARGAVASASSVLAGYAIHAVAHLNDGLYGNDHSWISATSGTAWAQIELPQAGAVSRVVLSRDREGRFRDRLVTGADVRVMAPMIATEGEAIWFAERVRALGLPKVGIMIEVPAAAIRSKGILYHVDFASLGTNDLQQYTMAADRMQGELADLLNPWEPALLDVVALACEGGAAMGKPIGVCGESAGDPGMALVLAGLGVSSLSMAPGKVAAVRTALSLHTLAECQQMAAAARVATTPKAAKAAVLAQADEVLLDELRIFENLPLSSGISVASMATEDQPTPTPSCPSRGPTS